jgi:hypothetical protein
LIIRCSQEDADRIRNLAFSEHRSLSGYLLHVLERSFWIENRVVGGLTRSVLLVHPQSIKREHEKVRTAVHLRCTVERAERTREYAARRRLSINDFAFFVAAFMGHHRTPPPRLNESMPRSAALPMEAEVTK